MSALFLCNFLVVLIVLVTHEGWPKGSSMVNSKRWPVRGTRAQGDSACREMHGGLPQPCEGRQTAENTWAQANPLSAGARSPAARGVVNVRDQGHRRRDHDEAVKMVNFSRDGKHEEEIVASKRANRCCRARGSPGVGRRSVTATRFARVSIDTTFGPSGLGLKL